MRKLLTILSAVLVAAVVATTAATAAQPERFRSDSRGVNAYWTQVDGPPAAGQQFGNVHAGWLDAYETSRGSADVYVYVDDFSCPAGVLPQDGWGHEGEEPTGEFCTYIGSRWGEGYGLAMTVDRKLTAATLRGTVTMSAAGGHGEPGDVLGRPTVDITLRGQGQLARSAGTWRSNDGGSRFFDRYTTQFRTATVSGNIGPMGFDPALSGGQIQTSTSMFMWQSR